MRGVLKPREERRVNDSYYTPQPLAFAVCQALVDHCGVLLARNIFEPGCGGGAFLRAANFMWPNSILRGVDLQPTCNGPGVVEKRDLFGIQTWGEYSLIVGNPGFLQAEPIVRHCLDLLAPNGHLAFLLRLSFLAGQRRLALYEQHPLRYLIPITPRPSFTPDGKTDASEYGVFVWQRGYTGPAEILPHIRWKR